MDIAYIDSDNYEILSSPNKKCFKVDKLLAEVISLLNQNGYKTISSSIGKLFNDDYVPMIVTKNDIEEIKKLDKVGYRLPGDDENIVYRIPVLNTNCYITFANIDLLPSIPEGFEKVDNTISCKIDYVENFDTFFEDGRKDTFISNYKIENQMNELSQKLLTWVLSFCESRNGE